MAVMMMITILTVAMIIYKIVVMMVKIVINEIDNDD